MDGLTFLAEIIKALLGSWPLAIILVVAVLKNQISILFKSLGGRIHKLKGKAKGIELEADFGKGVDRVEEIAPPEKPQIEADKVKRLELAQELTLLPPGYVVSQAWLKLEKTIRQAVDEDFAREDAKTLGAMRARPSLNAYLNPVTLREILPASDVEAIQSLRQLRNKAAHDLDPDISVTDALRYDDIANSLIEKINAYRERRSQPPNQD